MNEEIKQYIQTGKKNLILIYILYLCGTIAPLLCVVGAILAYINQTTSNGMLRSHYVFALRTFWIGFAGMVISMVTTLILIGPIIYIVVCIWFVIRVVVALRLLVKDQEHLNPNTLWLN